MRAVDRFFARVSPEPNSGCWLWTGSCTAAGYGRFSPTMRRGQSIYAHRFSYEMHVGSIDDGLVIDHLCKVRCCVNPNHLEVVTRGENVRRGDAPTHASRRSGKCVHGHELTDDNLMGIKQPRCLTCYRDWCEQRDVRKIIDRIARRARAAAALQQPNL